MQNHRSRILISLVLLLFTSFAHAADTQEKEWNLLIYLNGVNSLDQFAPINLKQMETVGSTDKLNILVQWGSESNPNTERLLVQKSTDATKITSPVVQNMGNVDMGDWHQVVNFVDWAHQNYPAKKYFVVIWDHGGGWHLPYQPDLQKRQDRMHANDISWDDKTGHFIKTEELGQAMAAVAKIIGHKVNIYGSDACLMGMIEVAAQMSDSVNYYVGSQETEPGDGWPYSTFLSKWTAQIDTLSDAGVATLLSKEYKAAYSAGGIYDSTAVTMAAYDLSQTAQYEQSLKQLNDSLIRVPPASIAKIQASANATKSFTYGDYKDVVDFTNQLAKNGFQNDSALQAVQTAQSKFVISNDQNTDTVTNGVSIWLPTEDYDYTGNSDRYQGLKFQQDTGWGELVKAIQAKQ